jgi:Orange carotenoid protein, N-terminal
MTASYDQQIPQALIEDAQAVVEGFNKLDTDSKLAWFYIVYKHMGESITPAAPLAAEPELAPRLLQDYQKLSPEQQLQIMREIVNKENTEYSSTYGALKDNNQLLVWYAWAEAMGDTVIGMPGDYTPTDEVKGLLAKIQELEFEGQMSVFRTIVNRMGYTNVQPAETQAQTGKTSSL